MAIKRYVASADTTITNAYKQDLKIRGTGSNMGAADVLEVFSIYGQASGSSGLSQELSRILVKFPIDNISADRTNGKIPASGSVNFYLRLFNAEHSETIPRNIALTASSVSKDWEEGTGLDMVEYVDETFDGVGANWTNYSEGNAWAAPGGDYHTDSPSVFHKTFSTGIEDMEVKITTLVEQWINSAGNVLGSKNNYGIGIRLSGTLEAYSAPSSTGGIIQNLTGSTKSYYTKKFFARGSEFFFKRPILEARWNSAKKDNRGNFYYSSSLAPAIENLNTLYLYNYVRGQLKDIPSVGTGEVMVSIYSGSSDDTVPSGAKLYLPLSTYVTTDLHTNVTGGWSSTGIYTASFAITSAATPVKTLYDVWHTGGVEFKTGSITPRTLSSYNINPTDRHVVNISNLRSKYSNNETARFRLYTRKKDWSPTIYSKAVATAQNTIIDSASYKIERLIDKYEIISYGTGSDSHTQLSHDLSGNYFDLDMSMLQIDFAYGMKFAFYNNAIGSWVEQPYTFKFRVEE